MPATFAVASWAACASPRTSPSFSSSGVSSAMSPPRWNVFSVLVAVPVWAKDERPMLGSAPSGGSHNPMTYRRAARLLGLAMGCALIAAPSAFAASGLAPGAPGDRAMWTPGDKHGFGTSTTLTSTVWHTLGGGELTEVYYPDLGTPAVRDLQFVVTDGKSWTDRGRQDTRHT